MPETDARKKWARENTTMLQVRLNNNTDADILQQLNRADNKQGYVKELIRADIKEGKIMSHEINTHGLTMTGLEAAAQETSCIRENSGHCVHIRYDASAGKVYATFFVDTNNWVESSDPAVISIGHFTGPTTAQRIADIIADSMQYYNKATQ